MSNVNNDQPDFRESLKPANYRDNNTNNVSSASNPSPKNSFMEALQEYQKLLSNFPGSNLSFNASLVFKFRPNLSDLQDYFSQTGSYVSKYSGVSFMLSLNELLKNDRSAVSVRYLGRDSAFYTKGELYNLSYPSGNNQLAYRSYQELLSNFHFSLSNILSEKGNPFSYIKSAQRGHTILSTENNDYAVGIDFNALYNRKVNSSSQLLEELIAKENQSLDPNLFLPLQKIIKVPDWFIGNPTFIDSFSTFEDLFNYSMKFDKKKYFKSPYDHDEVITFYHNYFHNAKISFNHRACLKKESSWRNNNIIIDWAALNEFTRNFINEGLDEKFKDGTLLDK